MHASWAHKRHIVDLPYVENFKEAEIPTKAKHIQMRKELVDTCFKEISDL